MSTRLSSSLCESRQQSITGEAHDSAEEGNDKRDRRHKMQSVKPDEIKTK